MKAHQLLLLVGALTMSSCLSSHDDDRTVTNSQTYDNCFAVIEQPFDGKVDIVLNPKFTIETQGYLSGDVSMNLTISNLSLPDMPNYTYQLPTLKMRQSSSTGVMSANYSDLKPVNISEGGITFNSLDFKMLQRSVANTNGSYTYLPVFSIKFSINSKYRVTIYPMTSYLFATTTAAPAAAPTQAFTTMKPTYRLVLDALSKTAKIEITGAQFMAQMPALNMTFGGIPWTVSEKGLELETASLIPTIDGTAFPQYEIKDLNWTFTPLHVQPDGTELNFICNPGGMGEFNVTAKLYDLVTVNS